MKLCIVWTVKKFAQVGEHLIAINQHPFTHFLRSYGLNLGRGRQEALTVEVVADRDHGETAPDPHIVGEIAPGPILVDELHPRLHTDVEIVYLDRFIGDAEAEVDRIIDMLPNCQGPAPENPAAVPNHIKDHFVPYLGQRTTSDMKQITVFLNIIVGKNEEGDRSRLLVEEILVDQMWIAKVIQNLKGEPTWWARKSKSKS